MSLKLPLQSKAIRPKFQNKKQIFGDEDDEEQVQDELVVGFEDNKLKEATPKKEKKPLTISPLPNADWRKMAQHKKELYIPAQALQQDHVMEEEKVVTYGLNIQKAKKQEATVVDMEIKQEHVEEVIEEKPKTLEEQAVEAIIKDSMGQNEDEEENGPKRVIQVDETLSFRDDVKNRPDETTMEDYENIPVEEFGAALLRGLGWNEGEGIGRNRKAAPAPSAAPVKQRDALLGLGAKPEDIPKERKYEHKRAAYTFKDTSLFKKISKKKLNDDEDSDYSEKSHKSSRNSSRESSSRRHRDRESDRRHGSSGSRNSSRESSSRRHKESSDRRDRRGRESDRKDRDSDRRSDRDSDRKRRRDDSYSHKSSSSSSSRKRSRSR